MYIVSPSICVRAMTRAVHVGWYSSRRDLPARLLQKARKPTKMLTASPASPTSLQTLLTHCRHETSRAPGRMRLQRRLLLFIATVGAIVWGSGWTAASGRKLCMMFPTSSELSAPICLHGGSCGCAWLWFYWPTHVSNRMHGMQRSVWNGQQHSTPLQ